MPLPLLDTAYVLAALSVWAPLAYGNYRSRGVGLGRFLLALYALGWVGGDSLLRTMDS